MLIRFAKHNDLPAIVAIYNTAIPDRLATADTEPVTPRMRAAWFKEFSPERRPLWVGIQQEEVMAWLGLRSFYGRRAYDATVEIAVYVHPLWQRRGAARGLLQHAIAHSPELGIKTILAFVFAHNAPSLSLFQSEGFGEWGRLPRVAELDAVERDLVILGKHLGR